MATEFFCPKAVLKEYISGYILSEYELSAFEDQAACFYPIGSAILCFSLDHPAVFRDIGSNQVIRHSKFNFIHQFKQPKFYQIISSPGRILHVVFSPYGAYKVLGIPQNCSFDEHGTSLLAIFQDRISVLLNQVEDAGSNSAQVIYLIESWLEKQLFKNEKIDVGRMNHACKLIEVCHGNLSIEKLASEVWLSKRKLEYQFQEQIGLPPKLYSRIMRFNALLAIVKQRKSIDWQELVFKYQYFDQAHLIKEIKCFSGNTPGYLSRQVEFLEHIS